MKSFFTAILCLTLLLCSFVSCQRPITTTERVTFDTLTLDTICPLFKNFQKPACHLYFCLSVASETTSGELKKTIDHFISQLPKDGTLHGPSNGQVNEMLHCYVKDYLMSYLSEGPNAIDNYGGDTLAAANWMSYEENVYGNVLYNDNGFLCYQLRTESYTGGAHGNTNVINAVLDLQSGDRVNLCDLFDVASSTDLNILIRQKLVEMNGCVDLDELSAQGLFFAPAEIEATENFYFDENGLTWQFDPYDIAPYSMGEINVSISWKEALTLLAADSEVMPLAKKYTTK